MGNAPLPRYKYILAIGDYACMLAAFLIAIQFRPVVRMVPEADAVSGMFLFALLGVVWGLLMQYYNLYKVQVVTTNSRQLILLLRGALYATIGFTLIGFFFRPGYWFDSRLGTAMLFSTSLFLMAIWRLGIFRTWWNHALSREKTKRRTAIIGVSKKAQEVAAQLRYGLNHDLHVVGFIHKENGADLPRSSSIPTLGGIYDLPEITTRHKIDNFIIASDTIQAEDLVSIAERCTALGRQVDIASNVFQILLEKWNVEEYGGIPVVRLVGARNSLMVMRIKRVFDIALVLVGLLILSPVFAVIALFVRLSSPGPIIYRQKRIGKYGKPFSFYKFRTMRPEGENSDENFRKEKYSQFMSGTAPEKIINKDRVTRIGRFLRKTSLDELPQLWNVLRGDMSLVGPRPPVPYEFEMYSEWQKKRLAVTPGCTGLWQISDRLNISFTDMVLLDFYYIENMSLWLDMQIMLKTIPVMIFGRGGK